MKILVRNLARSITQAELLALFAAHGLVQSCTLVMDEATGGSKGFGFANMPVPHEAKAAIRALNGFELNGSKIRVKKAEPSAADVTSEQNSVSEQRATEVVGLVSGSQVATADARLKKDGTPLGPKKLRSFKKKASR